MAEYTRDGSTVQWVLNCHVSEPRNSLIQSHPLDLVVLISIDERAKAYSLASGVPALKRKTKKAAVTIDRLTAIALATLLKTEGLSVAISES